MGFDPIGDVTGGIKSVLDTGVDVLGGLGKTSSPNLEQANKAVADAIASMKESFDEFESQGKSFVDAGFDANAFIQDPEGHMDTFRSNAIAAGITSRAGKLGGTSDKAVAALQERAATRQGAVVEQEGFARDLQNAQLGQQLLARSQNVNPTQLQLNAAAGIGQAQADALNAQNVQQAALIQGTGNIALTTLANQGNFGFNTQPDTRGTGFEFGPPGIGSGPPPTDPNFGLEGGI